MVGKIGDDRKGIFIVIDGLDGVGKGVIERALIEYEQKLGMAVYDTIAHSQAWGALPELKDFWAVPAPHYNTIVTGEPSYAWIGAAIRNEMVSLNGRNYLADDRIQAYSLDRLIQMKRVVIPALQNGINVIQSRCMASTLTYQCLNAIDEKRNSDEVWDRILQHEGNQLQLKYAPDLLIIPRIDDAKKVIERIKARVETSKDDKTVFENLEFQSRLMPLYTSDKLKDLFEGHGTVVRYLDAGISVESSRKQAVDIYKEFLASRKK